MAPHKRDSSRARTQLRVALYSHDTMGIGHMRRNLLIAQTLAAEPISATVLVIAGAREASAFALPANVDCLTLPALAKTDGRYQPRVLGMSLSELVGLRAQTIAASLRAFAPDLLIADKEPRGALGELEPGLAALKLRGRTRCVLGLRDVLDEPSVVRRQWRKAGNERVIDQYYDAIWVYGDPTVYDLIDECRFAADVRAKAVYTGYLDPRQRLRTAFASGDRRQGYLPMPPGPYALCMVGGGQDGAAIAEAFAAAELPAGRQGVIITGPCMPADARTRLLRRADADPSRLVYEFHPAPCRLLGGAERVVAMGGYNTVTEILGFAKPALLAPRVAPRQEQMIRACRLRELGLVDVLTPDQITPVAVSRWLAKDVPAMTAARHQIDLAGLERLPGLVHSLLDNSSTDRMAEARHAIV